MAAGTTPDDASVRYQAYSRLQAAALAMGETLPISEIVAIGGQSDGKSTLLEALLGFRFNVKDVEMGTRRPLIVQMVHSPEFDEPQCRLQEEDSEEYGAVITPASAVANAIRERTESLLRRTGGTVSAKPLVMRAEFKQCPDITLIDLPGCILHPRDGEADSTPDDIMQLVQEQITPPHRLILFLQQSSVEWCSSLWMHVVESVDPGFLRSVVVASKFDNRLKEFSAQREVDQYLSASGYLPSSVRPFFIALPKDRNLVESTEWRQAIEAVDEAVIEHLRDVGFDEARYGERIGFGKLKWYLEEELQRRYRDAAPSTLTVLQQRCELVAAELATAEQNLANASDVPALRSAAMRHVFGISRHVRELLDGAMDPPPEVFGATTVEEHAACCFPRWPGVSGEVNPPNAALRLYGGAAFERALNEFQLAVETLEFPKMLDADVWACTRAVVSREKVANVLLAKGSGLNIAQAARGIARSVARELLSPLLDAACARLGFVLRRAYDVACERQQLLEGGEDRLRPYVAFHAALRSAYQSIVGCLEEQCRVHVQHHLDAATSEIALASYGNDAELSLKQLQLHDDELENAAIHTFSKAGDDMHERMPLRESQLTVPETPSPDATVTRKGMRSAAHRPAPQAGPQFSADPAKQNYIAVCALADKLFGRIREVVASQLVPTTLKVVLLEPLAAQLGVELSTSLFACTDDKFMGLFTAQGAVAVLESRRDALAQRWAGLVRCKDEFGELARCL